MFTTFGSDNRGGWQVTSLAPVKGDALAPVPFLSIVRATAVTLPLISSHASWRLAGVASHMRCVERGERAVLGAVQTGRGRLEASRAALIPIRRSSARWM
jgi:hypothetical protein